MIKINESERNAIIKAHLEYKAKLNEQQKPMATPGDLNITPARLGAIIVNSKVCFCAKDLANCSGPFNNNGVITIQGKMLTNSAQNKPDGKPVYQAGNVVNFNLNDYTYVVGTETTKNTWKCSSIVGSIQQLRRDVMEHYRNLGYYSLEDFPDNRTALTDREKYNELDLGLVYPFLYPKWLDTQNYERFLYIPKSTTFQVKSNSYPQTQQERDRIAAVKQTDPRLKTMEEVLTDEGVKDFSAISGKYTPYKIGKPGDNVFNRDFFLYYRNVGQEAAKTSVDVAKKAMKELNISKATCAKLINNYYEAYKVNQENMNQTDFDTIKTQVTYCARKYDNYGLLGGNKVDEKLDTLKGLSSNNKFKITFQ